VSGGSSACEIPANAGGPRRPGRVAAVLPSDSSYTPVDSRSTLHRGREGPGGAVSCGSLVSHNPYFRRLRRGAPEHAGLFRCVRTLPAPTRFRGRPDKFTTKKDHMRAPVSDRRPRSGMTLTPRHRQSRPLPMSAVAVRRGQFGEFELRPVREHTVEALTAAEPASEN
jgi:hypothetical protein